MNGNGQRSSRLYYAESCTRYSYRPLLATMSTIAWPSESKALWSLYRRCSLCGEIQPPPQSPIGSMVDWQGAKSKRGKAYLACTRVHSGRRSAPLLVNGESPHAFQDSLVQSPSLPIRTPGVLRHLNLRRFNLTRTAVLIYLPLPPQLEFN